MKSFALTSLLGLAAVACCLGLPLLIGATGLAAVAAWGGLGVLITALLVAGFAWARRAPTPKAERAPFLQQDCCASPRKGEIDDNTRT